MSDRTQELLDAYVAEGSRGAGAEESPVKIDVILELETIKDPRVLPFLLQIISDPSEYDLARIEALKVVENMDLEAEDRVIAAPVVRRVLKVDEDWDVRDYAAMAMSNLMIDDESVADVEGVVLDQSADRNLRHNAFFALERTGPTHAAVEAMQRVSQDREFEAAAKRVLTSWGLEGPTH